MFKITFRFRQEGFDRPVDKTVKVSPDVAEGAWTAKQSKEAYKIVDTNGHIYAVDYKDILQVTELTQDKNEPTDYMISWTEGDYPFGEVTRYYKDKDGKMLNEELVQKELSNTQIIAQLKVNLEGLMKSKIFDPRRRTLPQVIKKLEEGEDWHNILSLI